MHPAAATTLDRAGQNCRTAKAVLNGVMGSRPLLRYRDPVVRSARSMLEVVAGLGLIDRVAPTPEAAGLALVGLAVGALALGAKRVVSDNVARGHGESRPDTLPVISERAQDRAAGLGYSICFADGFAWRGGTRTGQCHYARAHIEIAPAWRWLSRKAHGTAQDAVDHLCAHELGHAAAFGARVFAPALDPRRNSQKAMLSNAISVCRERDLAVMARGFHDPRGVEEVFAESAALADDAEQGRATRMGEEYLWSHLGATPPTLRARVEIDRLVEAAKAA